jgi:hypothetical protein
MSRTEKILHLRPTQFAVGMLEVQAKIDELKSLSKADRKKSFRKMPIPVVVAPTGELFIIDHHHHVLAAWTMGCHKVPVKVAEDFSKTRISYARFWSQMRLRHWTHLYDQFGKGPQDPMYLPKDIRGMSDDPYRSLAWLVREMKGFEKSDKPFAEFNWAELFREHRLLREEFELDFKAASKKARRLARSRAARKLPGYLG